MHLNARTVAPVLLSILLIAFPVLSQETEHEEQAARPEQETSDPKHGEEAGLEEHGAEHEGRPHHANHLGVFVGLTDKNGYANEPTLGLDYRRLVASRLAVGALFDYAGGEMRNGIVAASVTWLPVGRLHLLAAPGIEFHRAQGAGVDCGCGGDAGEDSGEHDSLDEDATYFVFRLGAGWHFPIGEIYGVSPNINVDFVDGEKVWVYGVVFTFAW